MAYDADGQLVNSAGRAFHFNLSAEQYQKTIAQGGTISAHLALDLPMREVCLRIVAHDPARRIALVPCPPRLVNPKHPEFRTPASRYTVPMAKRIGVHLGTAGGRRTQSGRAGRHKRRDRGYFAAELRSFGQGAHHELRVGGNEGEKRPRGGFRLAPAGLPMTEILGPNRTILASCWSSASV